MQCVHDSKKAPLWVQLSIVFHASRKARTLYRVLLALNTPDFYKKRPALQTKKATRRSPWKYTSHIYAKLAALFKMSLCQTVEITFCVQRGHTAGACRGDGLTIDMVHYVAGCEYARNTGLRRVALDP